MYYADKIATLKDIFGTQEISLESDCLKVNRHVYPIVDDVIIFLEPAQYPSMLKERLRVGKETQAHTAFAEDIQFTFGEEWTRFPDILKEHEQEFRQYFDLIDLSSLKDKRICDLGCGIGRWSYFLSDYCRELVLVDFSEAIFVARRNLAHHNKICFFMGDLKKLPFKANFADFLFCLGVLHHLPTPALDEIRFLKKYAPKLLIYLYYALDNRPFFFRVLLALVTQVRLITAKVTNPTYRELLTWLIGIGVYFPLVLIGTTLRPFGLAHHVPLYEAYHGKGLKRIRQDVYDRFFTRIEQRFSRQEIISLKDTFSQVIVSEELPYWHFICER